MVAIAHLDSYAIFMRKIGYSVGLEKTFKRVNDLLALYQSDKDVTISSWKKLVSASWGLKSDNIADVFYSLRLIQKTSSDFLILENLDAMAIACTMLESTEERQRAQEFILLWAIMANDGEIFVNLLLAKFEARNIKEILSSMIKKKRDRLCEVLPGKDSSKRIYRAVNIERQEKNRGGAGSGGVLVSHNRVEPLQSRRTLPLDDEPSNYPVMFSKDYFRKVPPRRKDWARALGLWDDECGLTQKGESFILGLKKIGYIKGNVFIFWPMKYELRRDGFRPDLFGEDTVHDLWQTLLSCGNAYVGRIVSPVLEKNEDEIVDLVANMVGIFRDFHTRKLLLRRELPITVAYPAIMAFAYAREEPVIDLPSSLELEQKGERRRITFRESRNTGGALGLRK